MNKLCDYGCGQEAKYQLKNGKWCCSKNWKLCKNSKDKLSINIGIKIENKNGDLCNYGCKNVAKYIFKNGNKCCEDRIPKCKKIKEINSKKMIKKWKDPNSKFNSKERKNKILETLKKNKNTEKYKESKENRIKKIKQLWKDPNSKFNTIEFRKLISENSKKNKSIKIKNEKKTICEYGCGKIAKYYYEKSKKYCCSKHWQSCPSKKLEKSEITKLEHLKPNSWFNSKECSEQRRQRALNGLAIKMVRSVKNISKQQIKLYNIIKKIYPNSVLEYPVENEKYGYKIDIAIFNKKIAIEYDGSYWHRNKDYDMNRQKIIESEGWKFIRYEDYIPPLDKILLDIKDLENK